MPETNTEIANNMLYWN